MSQEKNELIVIDPAVIELTVKNADQIFINASGEEFLKNWLAFKEKVEIADKLIKTSLEIRALDLNPNFKAIIGDTIKVGYRFYGAKYKLEPGLEHNVEKSLVKIKTSYSLDTKALEEYLTGKPLPYGVAVSDRKKQIVFGNKSTMSEEE